MRLAVFLGTRPQAIKMAPVIHELVRQRLPFDLIEPGQHYDHAMSEIFYQQLKLPGPDFFLKVGGLGEIEQFAAGLTRSADVLRKIRPDMVIVNGDTNSTAFAALAAAKLKIPLCHVEAGCRSFDLTMPEEINRLLTDHLASLWFPPTDDCATNLAAEGIPANRTFMYGNTAVDSFREILPAAKRARSANKLGLSDRSFVLATLHRQENVDEERPLRELLTALSEMTARVVFPVHPRTRKRIGQFGLGALLRRPNILATDPLGYVDFISLLLDCEFAVSDSGGVIEEAALAGKRVIIPRTNIEWYEIVDRGVGVLTPSRAREIAAAVKWVTARKSTKVPQVYPHLRSSSRTVRRIKLELERGIELGRNFLKEGKPELRLGAGIPQLLFGRDGRPIAGRSGAAAMIGWKARKLGGRAK